jgi:hypothetical protein
MTQGALTHPRLGYLLSLWVPAKSPYTPESAAGLLQKHGQANSDLPCE